MLSIYNKRYMYFTGLLPAGFLLVKAMLKVF